MGMGLQPVGIGGDGVKAYGDRWDREFFVRVG